MEGSVTVYEEMGKLFGGVNFPTGLGGVAVG